MRQVADLNGAGRKRSAVVHAHARATCWLDGAAPREGAAALDENRAGARAGTGSGHASFDVESASRYGRTSSVSCGGGQGYCPGSGLGYPACAGDVAGDQGIAHSFHGQSVSSGGNGPADCQRPRIGLDRACAAEGNGPIDTEVEAPGGYLECSSVDANRVGDRSIAQVGGGADGQGATVDLGGARVGVRTSEGNGARSTSGEGPCAGFADGAGEIERVSAMGCRGDDVTIQFDGRADRLVAGINGNGGIRAPIVKLENSSAALSKGVASPRGIEGDSPQAGAGAIERHGRRVSDREHRIVEGGSVRISEARFEPGGALIGSPVGSKSAGERAPFPVPIGVPSALAGINLPGDRDGGRTQVGGCATQAGIIGESVGEILIDGSRALAGCQGGVEISTRTCGDAAKAREGKIADGGGTAFEVHAIAGTIRSREGGGTRNRAAVASVDDAQCESSGGQTG